MSAGITSSPAGIESCGHRVVPPNVCDTEYATNTALKIVTSILNYYLPLALMYALYTKIFVEASRLISVIFNAVRCPYVRNVRP